MIKILFPFFCSLLLISCSFVTPQYHFTIEKVPGFPKWLPGTDQTSGITFIDTDENGNKQFLMADDIGKLHRLQITNDTIINIYDIKFSQQVINFFNTFPKWDFEDISFDKYTGKIYLSVEGNGKLYKEYISIYSVSFYMNNIYSDSVISVTKLDFNPGSVFLKHAAPNIGYEGLTVDENYFYLGLEGYQQGTFFADSTIIYIAEKNTFKIIDSINTKSLGISTICGLYSNANNSLFGIDRNGRKVFHIILNSKHQVEKVDTASIESVIPGYHYQYAASLESITFDDENNMYLTDDPWRSFYIPSADILGKMDSVTVNNFKNYTPIIYKFRTNF